MRRFMTARSCRSVIVLPLCLTLFSTPLAAADKKPAKDRPFEPADLYASTYKPLPSRPTLVTNATVLTAAGERIEGGAVLMRDGKIAAVGRQLTLPAGAVVIDARGKWVTPGVIDAHSHLGVYASPDVDA